MQFGLAILARIGLLAQKSAQVDPQFDLRLQRLGAREQLRVAQTGPIKGAARTAVRNPPEPRAV